MVDVASSLNAMYCLAKICYVCLEQKRKLISNINSSLSVNKDIIHIIGYLPFNLAWLKTLQIILICKECCLRLRETYQFLKKCSKNSALLQTYVDNLNITSISTTENEAELLVRLNILHEDINEVKCEIQSEDEEIYTFQCKPNIEVIGDVFVDFEDSLIKEGIICTKEVDDKQDNNSIERIEETKVEFLNLDDYFVKEENTWKREEVNDTVEYPTDNNSTDNMDSEIPVTNTDCVSSGFTCDQVHATNKYDLNTAAKQLYKRSTCSKSFIAKSDSNIHTRIHRQEKSYECTICKTCYRRKSNLISHMRVHTHEKPYNCSRCEKCFSVKSSLVRHVRVHTEEKPYNCTICKKCFTQCTSLVSHMRIHTGEKPYSCSRCKKCFRVKSNLVRHMRIHTCEKANECC